MDLRPPFPADLTPEDEIARFERLKPRLDEVWQALVDRDEEPYTSVVVPSLTLDQSELRKLPGASFYEERLLFLLIRLRNPRARITSSASGRCGPQTTGTFGLMIPAFSLAISRSDFPSHFS